MKIVKILNNNVVVARENGEEFIAMGKGLGFQKKCGDLIFSDKVEKYFTLADRNLSSEFNKLMSNIEPAAAELSEKIISMSCAKFPDKQLSESVHITLADHINGVIERHKLGITLDNAIWTEIFRIYPDEFEVGLYAVKLLNERLGYKLGNDEAAFIAVHFINAQSSGISGGAESITKLINDVTEMVKAYFKIDPDTSGVYYYRFISHIKSFARTVLSGEEFTEEDSGLCDFVETKYSEAFDCAAQIDRMIEIKYKSRLTKDDIAYLALYIDRLVR